MRVRVLTDLEREIIQEFVQNGKRLQGFRMLKMRVKRYHKRILEDSKLVKKFLEAVAMQ